jgi:formate/nitrite transporter FocA (FNT family)
MSEARAPREVARLVARAGEGKLRTDLATLGVLSILGGAFIALGALFFLSIVSDSTLGVAPTRLLGGFGFSLGLILVVVAGAELFTGNNLLAVAWASGEASFRQVVSHWIVVYLGNVVGALATVVLAVWSDVAALGEGALATAAASTAAAKANSLTCAESGVSGQTPHRSGSAAS